jgi:benzoyl-CoA reductase/2-hydroxyglutaryl-CoA dehydratase subunit BcrC/BadD/HgdB
MRQPLKNQASLKGLLTDYYGRLVSNGKPIAWCTSVGPAELLRAFGYEVYFPENHGALIGAKRLGGKYIPFANQAGFSADICSYLTCDVGAFLAGETPLEDYGLAEVPRPEVLVFNTSQCREVKEWFGFYSEKFQVPCFGIHTPRNIDGATPPLLNYLRESWQELIRELERLRGVRLDLDYFKEVTALSHEACQLWQDFLESNQASPAPHTFFDHIILMAPAVVLRGTPEAKAFYQGLMDEVSGLNTGDIKERWRFYWEGMPIWGKIRFLAQLFEKHQISIVASTYSHSWAFDFAASDMLASMIRAYATIFITQSQTGKLQYLSDVAKRFNVDAFIFHDAKTCPHNTNNRYALPGRVTDSTGLPVLTIYGDLVDLRHFSEEEMTLRLEAFVEHLD